MNVINLVEYVSLRIVRRCIPMWLTRYLLNLIPGFNRSVGSSAPGFICDVYTSCCARKNITIQNKNILEIGCGSTNGTGYELLKRGAASWTGYEPFEQFDRNVDIVHKMDAIPFHSVNQIEKVIHRIVAAEEILPGSFDCIFSFSVLEHVKNLCELFALCKYALKPDGIMIHCVDYRDHFFKYPFHFLLFSGQIWNRFLSPGDLYRYRICDHISSMQQAGFSVAILSTKKDPSSFKCVSGNIHAEFKNYKSDDLMTTYAELAGVIDV